MDIGTGKTYETVDEALKDGVAESDIAHVTEEGPRFIQRKPTYRFSKGSFKRIAAPVRTDRQA